jgi:DNA-binding transcriptional LysR family regulator
MGHPMKRSELISQRLKLQHLNVLMAVAQWASMAKAAKHLGVSQPVVSKVIADLEDLLEVRLFERSPQGVEPTLYGRALIKRSIALFDDLKTSVDEIEFLADPSAGELRIGSTEPLFAGLVTAVIERVWEQHPRIAFRVVQADGATLINRDLPERRIELAVIPLLAPSVREDLDVTVLYRDSLHVVAGLKSPWARRRKITLADLSAEPWCAPPYETPIVAARRGFPHARPRYAAPRRRQRPSAPTDCPPARRRAPPRDHGGLVPALLLSGSVRREETAGRSSHAIVRGCGRDRQGQDHQPGRPAFHRLRARRHAPVGAPAPQLCGQTACRSRHTNAAERTRGACNG